jgi:hypothetical protein
VLDQTIVLALLQYAHHDMYFPVFGLLGGRRHANASNDIIYHVTECTLIPRTVSPAFEKCIVGDWKKHVERAQEYFDQTNCTCIGWFRRYVNG